jgi:beta-glucosidase
MAPVMSVLSNAVLVVSGLATLSNAAVVPRQSAGYVAAPYYPAPYGGWTANWADSYAKAKALVDKMTLAEKTNITAGTGIYMGMITLPFPPLSVIDSLTVSITSWTSYL